MPGRLAVGALLFGFTDALRTRQEATVTALLIGGAVAFAFLAYRAVRSRNRGETIGYSITAVGLAWWFLGFGAVPSEFVSFAPPPDDALGPVSSTPEDTSSPRDRCPLPTQRGDLIRHPST